MQPTITGPVACSATDPPPRFEVDTAGLLLYMVELACSQHLMACLADRTGDNYFFGGEPDNAFATGSHWCVPAPVWTRLRLSPLVYYRVVAVDPVHATFRSSVTDHDLHLLPAIRIGPAGRSISRRSR